MAGKNVQHDIFWTCFLSISPLDSRSDTRTFFWLPTLFIKYRVSLRVIHFFQKCRFSLLLSTFLSIWNPQRPKMSILALTEVVCLCNKGDLFRVFNIFLHKLSPNKYGSCCICKPPQIELNLTFLDFVGHKYSEKSRGARKIDTFGKSESP